MIFAVSSSHFSSWVSTANERTAYGPSPGTESACQPISDQSEQLSQSGRVNAIRRARSLEEGVVTDEVHDQSWPYHFGLRFRVGNVPVNRRVPYSSACFALARVGV